MATVSNKWIPEDDFLLKNAVETGASLEALAKGAIQFSQRYTLRELRERWLSLLYDPDISAQASARIFQLEITGFNPASKLNREIPKKRKHVSMRKKYYTMRKKFRSEFFNNTNLGFFEPNPHEFNGDSSNPLGQECMIGDGISDPLELQEDDLDILRHAFPGPVRDVSLRKGSMDEIRQHLNSPSSDGFSSFQEFADPDSLLNLSNEDEVQLVEIVDEKSPEDNKCCGVEVDNADSVTHESSKVEHETVTLPEGDLKVDVALELTSGPDISDLSHGNIICTLNTEDTEIPCNDDIFLLIHPSMSFNSSPTHPNPAVSVNACGTSYENNNNDEQVITKGKDSTRACPHPQKVGMRGKADIPGFVNNSVGNSCKERSVYTIIKPCSKSLAEKGVDMKVGDSSATVIQSMKTGSTSTLLPESLVNDSASEHEELSQIDDDVPYFSDIEAMILEMDLDPCDQDTHSARQVPNYQYDDTKRTIIRLEQAVRSCLQRAMTSHGTLAILYGRHLRHYIKKPEVILGRSTDDVHVDIDLRKEGRANKISRRQAIIKMEANGSFSLRNLGKSSVSVNGDSVATGQLVNLSSSCVIEIKGMSFVFEINQGYVRKQVENFCPENRGKTIKSDRLAEH